MYNILLLFNIFILYLLLPKFFRFVVCDIIKDDRFQLIAAIQLSEKNIESSNDNNSLYIRFI